MNPRVGELEVKTKTSDGGPEVTEGSVESQKGDGQYSLRHGPG